MPADYALVGHLSADDVVLVKTLLYAGVRVAARPMRP
jgi:hypothetical protein